MATPTIEEYLEAIYVIAAETPPVRSARVAEVMGVSAPTLTDTVRRLVHQGHAVLGKRKEIILTDQGRAVAEAMVRRHRLSERWLVDVLGMDWSKVHEEACRLEHALSPEVEARLARALNDPSTCPHGNPIPGLGKPSPGEIPLGEMEVGSEAILVRVAPEGEKNPALLDHLRANGLVPGARILMVEAVPWKGLVTVEASGARSSLGTEAAALVRVSPSG